MAARLVALLCGGVQGLCRHCGTPGRLTLRGSHLVLYPTQFGNSPGQLIEQNEERIGRTV
jgi:hypothetical protein